MTEDRPRRPADRRKLPARFLGQTEIPASLIAKPPEPTVVDLGGKVSKRLVAGCMTGTSLDGLDAALVAIEGHGLHLRATLVGHLSRPLGDLGPQLRRLAEQEPMSAGAIAKLAQDFALFHLDCLGALAAGRRIDLVAIHGQTVYHSPPISWQLFNPAPVAQALGVPVVCDLRAADLAQGGQGAPITPLADLIMFGHRRERRVIANLGGFCNITRLPAGGDAEGVEGADICACNQLLDAVARQVLGLPYDEHGETALVGTVRVHALRTLRELLSEQRHAGRSLGTGDELAAWVGRSRKTPPADLARTACAAIASTIVEASQPCDRLVVAGGGTLNRALMAELKERSPVPVQTTDSLGVPAAYREAVAMAVLGALCQDRVPITLPKVTGVGKTPVAGMWCLP